MIRSAVAIAVVGSLALVQTANADEFPAMSACRPNLQSANISISDVGIQNHDTANAVTVFCPLKRMTCSSTNCTYTATIYGVDNNASNAADANVICGLHLALDYTAGTHFHGSDATFTTGTISPSVTVNNGVTGLVYARCSIGKGGSSFVTWITSSF